MLPNDGFGNFVKIEKIESATHLGRIGMWAVPKEWGEKQNITRDMQREVKKCRIVIKK